MAARACHDNEGKVLPGIRRLRKGEVENLDATGEPVQQQQGQDQSQEGQAQAQGDQYQAQQGYHQEQGYDQAQQGYDQAQQGQYQVQQGQEETEQQGQYAVHFTMDDFMM